MLGALLGFDIDPKDVELYARRYEFMTALAAAGAAVVCWLRREGSCHIELYFDRAVSADAAYAWCITVCPALATIRECYPAAVAAGEDKRNLRLSWPLWLRIGNQVTASRVECMLPDRAGEIIEHPGIRADRPGLEVLLGQAVTPTALIPPLPPVEPGAAADEGNTHAKQAGGVLLDVNPLEVRAPHPNSDGMGKAAIAEFNATHTWDYVFGQAAQCGRYSVRADDKSPSIVPNPDNRTAKDYGRNGEYHDKFDWWLIAHKLDKTAETNRLIADYRNRVDAHPTAPAPTESPDLPTTLWVAPAQSLAHPISAATKFPDRTTYCCNAGWIEDEQGNVVCASCLSR